jgi:hypothetical protein
MTDRSVFPLVVVFSSWFLRVQSQDYMLSQELLKDLLIRKTC